MAATSLRLGIRNVADSLIFALDEGRDARLRRGRRRAEPDEHLTSTTVLLFIRQSGKRAVGDGESEAGVEHGDVGAVRLRRTDAEIAAETGVGSVTGEG